MTPPDWSAAAHEAGTRGASSALAMAFPARLESGLDPAGCRPSPTYLRKHMPSTVQAILNTPDLDRAKRFYTQVFGAIETSRVPDEGPIFYLGMRIGDSDFGLVVNA